MDDIWYFPGRPAAYGPDPPPFPPAVDAESNKSQTTTTIKHKPQTNWKLPENIEYLEEAANSVIQKTETMSAAISRSKSEIGKPLISRRILKRMIQKSKMEILLLI